MTKIRFIASADLADGSNSIALSSPEVVADVVREWAKNVLYEKPKDGHAVSITIKRMTDEAVDRLPEI